MTECGTKVLVLTSQGIVYSIDISCIPKASRTAKGKKIDIGCVKEGKEKVVAMFAVDFTNTIIERQCIVMLTRNGSITRVPLQEFAYVSQEGMIAILLDSGDELITASIAQSLSMILFFTMNGMVYGCWLEQIPEYQMQYSHIGIKSLIGDLLRGDAIFGMLCVDGLDEGRFSNRNIDLFTKNGLVKKCDLAECIVHVKGGKIVINLREDDQLCAAALSDEKSDFLIITHDGLCVRFEANTVRIMSRRMYGVWGILLHENDRVIGGYSVKCDLEEEKHYLISLTENGFIRRTLLDFFGATSNRRGVKGTAYYKANDETGRVCMGVVL